MKTSCNMINRARNKEVFCLMMTRESDDKRAQIIYLYIDDLVPEDHLLRLIDRALD